MDLSSFNIWEKLSKLAKAQKKPFKEAAKTTGVSEGAISGWKKSFPTVDNLAFLARYYGVSLDYLVFDEAELTFKQTKESAFSHEEQELIYKYRNLSGDNKRNIGVLVDSMLQTAGVGEKGVSA